MGYAGHLFARIHGFRVHRRLQVLLGHGRVISALRRHAPLTGFVRWQSEADCSEQPGKCMGAVWGFYNCCKGLTRVLMGIICGDLKGVRVWSTLASSGNDGKPNTVGLVRCVGESSVMEGIGTTGFVQAKVNEGLELSRFRLIQV